MYRTLVPHQNVPVWKEASRKGIAYHTHLYTKIISGNESDHFENWFEKEFETPAKHSIEKAISDNKLSPDDWRNLIRYLAAQDVRTPSKFMEVTKRHQSTFQEILDETLKNSTKKLVKMHNKQEVILTSQIPPEKSLPIKVHYDKNTGIVQAKGITGRSSWLWSIQHLLNHTAKILHERKWTIMKPSKGFTWFTSDKPVLILNFRNLENYDFKGGWGVKGTDIFMPLSPVHMLYTEIGKKPPLRGSRFTKDQTQLIRRFFAENASRMIFTDKKDTEITQLRQRVVDPISVKNEKQLWENWHESQSKLEFDLEEWKINLSKQSDGK